LRHLHAVYLRNLTLAPEYWRSKNQTVDDEALPQSLQTPTKLRARQNRVSSEFSRSSTDISGLQTIKEDGKKKSETLAEEVRSPRSVLKRTRRRSTLDSSTLNPVARQKQLEEDALAGMLDAFFSLHVDDHQDPVYVSETCERTRNPTFRNFNLFDEDSAIMRTANFTIKVWAKTELDSAYILLLQSAVNMRHLQFVGKTLDSYRRLYPPNCVLFHLKDGLYTTFLNTLAPIAPFEGAPASLAKPLPSSSYDALMRLSSLDIAIQDSLATRRRLEREISDLLNQNAEAISTVRSVVSAQESVINAQNVVSAETKRLAATRARRDHLLATIQARKDYMQKSREYDATQLEIVKSGGLSIREQQSSLEHTKEDIHGQRRRVCEDLQRIFPIDPVQGAPKGSLLFSVRGLSLPNAASLDDAENGPADAHSIAAALGYTALLITQLAAYLNIPLPYPLEFRGSSSTVTDSLSASTPTTIYPLFSRSVARFRFEYAVFLLNKNIEIIAAALGLKLLDPRHTLPNLKYILFVASSGEGDLPARKVGGLRAFLHSQNMSGPEIGKHDNLIERIGFARSFGNGGAVPDRGSRLRYES
jgi:hypothetical protein